MRTVSTDVSSSHGRGKADTTGYGIGSTLTCIGAGGVYVDGQAGHVV
ncbi:autotransporter outer membrane beta-barrel domain-containing protein [Paramesorhizobium deserti]|nr:autotransporter outer membrane beta-barrel domain-containing protein [Paramesorhizobium deserti]